MLEAPPKPTKVAPDHFLHQFDRYPEGEPRLRAATEHTAFVLNSGMEKEWAHERDLTEVLASLVAGEVPAAIAVRITELLRGFER